MSPLPHSIAATLEELGISETERQVLAVVSDGAVWGIRDVSAQVGKGLSATDGAIKKLVSRGFLHKVKVNGIPKLRLPPLQEIIASARKELQAQKDMIDRRGKDLEIYLSTLQEGVHRTDVQHFEGEAGIARAMTELVRASSGEILHVLPQLLPPSTEAFRQLEVDLFKKRYQHGQFIRCIAPDTIEGKRMQSHDMFSYRQTRLMPAGELSPRTELVVSGNLMCTIDYSTLHASLIKSEQLAEQQRAHFNALWHRTEKPSTEDRKAEAMHVVTVEMVPLRIRLGSTLRAFVLSKSGIVTMAVGIVLATLATAGYGMAQERYELQKLQTKAKAIAATAAIQFTSRELALLQSKDDIRRPEYASVINRLQRVRENNDNVRFVYIMRPTSDPATWEFVADADSLDPDAKIDLNHDGLINDADHLSPPGEKYSDDDAHFMQQALEQPLATNVSTDTQWGDLFSGYAPIVNENGKGVAVIGVDYDSTLPRTAASNPMMLSIIFITFLLLIVIVRFTAANKSLVQELLSLLYKPRALVGLGILCLVGAGVTYGMHMASARLLQQQTLSRLRAIAATGALQFTAEEVDQIRVHDDVTKPVYKHIATKLHEIQQQNDSVKYAYILRPTEFPAVYEFVSASDAVDPFAVYDTSGDGIVDDRDDLGIPGVYYNVHNQDAIAAGIPAGPIANSSPYTDRWGTFLSGFAPIRGKDGKAMSVLGIDIEAKDLQVPWGKAAWSAIVLTGLAALLLLAASACALQESISRLVRTLSLRRAAVVVGTLLLLCTSGALVYRASVQRAVIEQTAQRLKAIVATSASQIDWQDLAVLRTKDDMRKPAYQRVFKTLNAIRDGNENIKWIYIQRPTARGGTDWEFVVDADSNYNLPEHTDWNHNGIQDAGDDNVWPGYPYDVSNSAFSPDTLLREAIAEPKLVDDQWGPTVSAAAPIFNAEGNAVANLNIDMGIEQLPEQWGFVEWTLSSLLGLSVLLLLWAAWNTSLLNRAFLRRVSLAIGITLILVALGSFAYRASLQRELVRKTGERLQAIVATAASQIDWKDLEALHTKEDMRKPEYQRVFTTLRNVRDNNEDILWLNIFRPTVEPKKWEIVVDTDANYNLPPFNDHNGNKVMEPDEENVWPGYVYEFSAANFVPQQKLFAGSRFDKHLITDKWGTTVSATAPIRNASGVAIAFLNADVDAKMLNQETRGTGQLTPVLVGISAALLLCVGWAASFLRIVATRKRVITAGIIVVLIGAIGFAYRSSMQHALMEQTAERLKAIAATAASQIDWKDLEVLHTKEDMQKPEYQRVFTKLNAIRKSNERIKWASVLRPTASGSALWEFVVDADANYNRPAFDDYDGDGQMDPDEENVWPGYPYTFSSPLTPTTVTAGTQYLTDKWGKYVSAYAPIFGQKNEVIAILTIDLVLEDL